MLAGHSGYLCPFQMNTAQRGSDKPHHSRGYLGVRICRSGALSLRCGASIKDRTLSDLGAREPNLVRSTERVEGAVAVVDHLTYRVGERLAAARATPLD
jgi:hypothetical protein